MKKTCTLLWIFFAAPLSLWAQQPFQFSQYFQNTMTLNPAVTGSEEFLDLKLGYRQQWSGLETAPETYFVSAHSPLAKKEREFPYQDHSLRVSDPNLYTRLKNSSNFRKLDPVHHGVGGYVVSDQQGIFSQQSAFLSYALHISVGAKTTLALGVSTGVNIRKIDVSHLNLGDNEIPDPTYEAYLAQQGRSTNLDLNSGVFLYSDKYYLGYSATRILQNEIYSDVENISGQQIINHYGLIGVRLKLNQNVAVLPGAFVKYNGIEPLLYDMNLRFKFDELAWVGASYRNTDIIAGMFGFNINNFINVSYSYDYGFAEVSNFSSNTHEIMLGFMLFNKRDTTPFLW